MIIERIEDITLPFLKSEMSVKKFAPTVGLSYGYVKYLILRDLRQVYKKVHKKESYATIPRSVKEKNIWIKRIEEYNAVYNLPERIYRDKRKISEITVEEFLAIINDIIR